MSTRISRRRIAALALSAVALTALVLTGCGPQPTSGPAAKPLNTVTASGSGTIQAAPDEATMSFGVSKSGSNPKSLLADVSKSAEKIVAALKKAGVADKDIQTQSVNLYPRTEFTNGKTVVNGYDASINVTAKVRDLATLGAVISAGNDAGANTMNGPSFGIAEDSPYTAKAIEKAVAVARRNAESMAKAADKSVGKVLNITDSGVSPVQPFPMASGAELLSAKSADVPINPGQLDVSSSVVVTFELK
jgi:uncharacterized protein